MIGQDQNLDLDQIQEEVPIEIGLDVIDVGSVITLPWNVPTQ